MASYAREARIGTILALLSLAPFVDDRDVHAQVTAGSITGIVQDSTGGTLPGVSVTIVDRDTQIARTVTTDDEGRYRAPSLGPGTYEVTATLAGFKTEVRSGLNLTIGREAVVNFTLSIGELAERVVVVGEAPLVETTNAVTANIVDEQQLKNMPLNGRDLTQLTILTPGVLPARTATGKATAGYTLKISIAGGRPQSNSFLLDGTDINANSNNTPGSVAGVQLGVDGIREFRVITNAYSAEFGRAGAGVVTSVSRSGTNDFHGSVFEFLRNDALDARNFFDRAEQPDFTRNQFGFSVGGPIVRARTFFFGNYEGLREKLGVSQTANVPNQLARDGRLPDPRNPAVTLPVSPVIRPYLETFPLPNGRDFGDGRGEYHTVTFQPTGEDYVTGRVDHTLGAKDSFYVRYTLDDARVDIPEPLGLVQGELRSRSQYLSAEEKRIVGSRSVNVARMAFNRTRLAEIDAPVADFEHLFFTDAEDAVPVLAVTGLQSWGARSGNLPKIYETLNWQFTDDLTYQRGRHSLKAGAGFQRLHFNIKSDAASGGNYGFQSLADFLRNSPRSFRVQFPGSDTSRRLRSSTVTAFVQDDIEITPTFTVNAGLRYEMSTNPTEVDDKISVLKNIVDPNAAVSDATLGGPLFETPRKNIAPRVGFAWAPGTGRTAVRGAFGLFYDTITTPYYQNGAVRMFPFFQAATADGTVLPIRFPDWRGLAIVPAAQPEIDVFPFLPESPKYLRHSVNLQRQIGDTIVVSAGYTGARGIHLVRLVAFNLEAGNTLNRRNPRLGAVTGKSTDGTADYHGATFEIKKRWSGGFQFQGAFTLAKSMDDGAAAGGNSDYTGDNTVPREQFGRDRGRSPWDATRSFVGNVVYDLPFGEGKRWLNRDSRAIRLLADGWQVSSIVQLSDGTPFSALLGYIGAGFIGKVDERTYYPNLRSGANANPVIGGANQYFDPSVFEIPASGQLGNLGRNTLEGPGLALVDISFVKNTRLGGSRVVQFRADVFNALNRANFGIPQFNVFQSGSTVARPDAGRITATATTARQVQLAVRFTF